MSKTFQHKFSSDPDNLVEIEKFVAEITKGLNIDEEISSNLSLSVSEASSNAIVHGNKLDPKKFVEITVIVRDDKIEVSIKDQGNGFNPDSIPDPTAPENLLKDSGRGIHIMKSFLDEVKYDFSPDGTIITLIASLK